MIRHLMSIPSSIVELQSSLTDTELMRNENCQLRNIVEDQRQQLDSCHTQLSCSKKLLRERGVAMATAQVGQVTDRLRLYVLSYGNVSLEMLYKLTVGFSLMEVFTISSLIGCS